MTSGWPKDSRVRGSLISTQNLPWQTPSFWKIRLTSGRPRIGEPVCINREANQHDDFSQPPSDAEM